MAVVPSRGVRVAVAESLICDLGRVSEWCDSAMKLNASETVSNDLDILGVTFHAKMTLRSNFALFPEQLHKDLVS